MKDVIANNNVVSEKVKVNNDILKYYIGYIIDDYVIPLVILLPIMSGWIKYFKKWWKNMNFQIEDDKIYVKYKSIWKRIKDLLSSIKLNSDIVYNDQYIKTKVKTFKMVKTLFDNDEIPEEKIEYECIPCISVDSVIKIKKK